MAAIDPKTSLEIRCGRTQIALQVIDIRLNKFAANGWPSKTFVGLISMATAERVVIITAFSADNPQDIDWRYFLW